MPCDSSYMKANALEMEISKVLCLLGELSGIPINRNHWEGYHPEVYCRGISRKDADARVERLCTALQNVPDITKYSLEMQMWWRDHQEADKKRLKRELANSERTKALSKLTPYERKLLDLE